MSEFDEDGTVGQVSTSVSVVISDFCLVAAVRIEEDLNSSVGDEDEEDDFVELFRDDVLPPLPLVDRFSWRLDCPSRPLLLNRALRPEVSSLRGMLDPRDVVTSEFFSESVDRQLFEFLRSFVNDLLIVAVADFRSFRRRILVLVVPGYAVLAGEVDDVNSPEFSVDSPL
jgi:hypothetical protein